MTRSLLKLLAALLLLFAGLAQAADEGIVNKLFGPGPLTLGHKNLEHGGSDCLKCHDTGNGVPNNKCLTCHTRVQSSITKGDTLHARVKEQPCISCHTDHKGRNFNPTQVDRKAFDHAKTGFPLTGSHQKVKCEKCHTQQHKNKAGKAVGMEFLGLKQSCVACHKKDDIHHFPPKQARLECSVCHNTTTWKEVTKIASKGFDHKKETGYELVGKHAQIKCDACHLDKLTNKAKYSFPELPKEKCLSCHADQHKDKLSAKFRNGTCEQCHTQTDWKIERFDHALAGYPLNGAHAKLPCVDCHKQGNAHKALKDFKWTGASASCVGCHKDFHGFGEEKNPKLGELTNCVHCHTEMDWRRDLLFSHDKDTRYPITGKHKQVPCFECHKPKSGGPSKKPFTPRTYDFKALQSKTCETCHKNPHPASAAKAFREAPCAGCHTTDGWKSVGGAGAKGGFNHSTMTKFVLDGDHAKLTCNQCHMKGGKEVYNFPGEDKKFCVTCHASPHKDQFSARFPADACATCHNTSAFKRLLGFDHDKTRFHLEGAHVKVGECRDCHTPTDRTLASKPPRPAGKFQFEHPEADFCVDCHKTVHQGQFDEKFLAKPCKDCHSQDAFAKMRPFDHRTAPFQITGAHAKFRGKCWNCHVPTNRMLASKPPHPAHKFQFGQEDVGFCEACHPSVHKDQFSEKFLGVPCKECHTTADWVRKLPFDHKQTAFELTGAHTRVAGKCVDCHVKTANMLPTKPPKPAGKFHFDRKVSGFCEDCHKTPHEDQFHAAFVDKPCRDCHVTASFERRKPFDHATTKFKVKGKHKEVKCAECHTATDKRFKESPHHPVDKYLFPNLAKDDCATCHKDPHNGSFGKNCSACHNENGWKTVGGGDFHKNFLLGGVHELLSCAECHKSNAKKLAGVGRDCQECHTKDDVHMGTQPDCASCHTQQFWAVSKFHHATTMFPLRGAHRTLECSGCHVQGVYEGLAPDCIACHSRDAQQVTAPNHNAGGFESCAQCHNQFSFSAGTP